MNIDSYQENYEKQCEKHFQRLGTRNPSCVICGEKEPSALTGTAPEIRCYECSRIDSGKSPIEMHHLSGQHNDPDFVVPLPGNAHRFASDLQKTWPVDTLRNPDCSPLLRASATIRGFLDILFIAIDYVMGWIPPFLESLDTILKSQLGDKWWQQSKYAEVMQ